MINILLYKARTNGAKLWTDDIAMHLVTKDELPLAWYGAIMNITICLPHMNIVTQIAMHVDSHHHHDADVGKPATYHHYRFISNEPDKKLKIATYHHPAIVSGKVWEVILA